MVNSSISWPLNQSPFFVSVLTVRDNLIFAARALLFRPPRYVIERAAYFAELQPGDLARPFASIADHQRRRISLSLTIPRGIPTNCNLLYLLYQGQFYMFEDIELGIRTFKALPQPSESELERNRGDGDGDRTAGLEAF